MNHSPYERLIEEFEDIGGIKVKVGEHFEVLCGCTEELRYRWGHHE